MASLKEIRSRIGSVKQTLKITSAMRLISSAKLHSAQNAISNMVAYEKSLKDLFATLTSCSGATAAAGPFTKEGEGNRTAVVLVTSNQTLCGGFNAALVKAFEAEDFPKDSTKVYAIGKFGLKAARKMGYETVDLCRMAEKARYEASVALSDELVGSFLQGGTARVVIVYAHNASFSSQKVKVETFLPIRSLDGAAEGAEPDYILEPSPEEFLSLLLPKVIKLSFHTILLDAQAAEHAARTVAMQMASENAETLLSELSLQYNKLRQQAITNEILDLVGGQSAN